MTAPQFKIRFWWPGYDPAQLLDPLQGPDYEQPDQWEVCDPAAPHWRTPRPGATLQTVRDYMVAQRLRVLRTQLGSKRRRARRWEGLFELSIGPAPERAA